MVNQLCPDMYSIIGQELPPYYLCRLATVSKSWHTITNKIYNDRFDRIWKSLSEYILKEEFNKPFSLSSEPDFYFFSLTPTMKRKWHITFGEKTTENKFEKLETEKNWGVLGGFGISDCIDQKNYTQWIKTVFTHYKACNFSKAMWILMRIATHDPMREKLKLYCDEFKSVLCDLFQSRHFIHGFELLKKLSSFWSEKDVAEFWEIISVERCLEHQLDFIMHLLTEFPRAYRFRDYAEFVSNLPPEELRINWLEKPNDEAIKEKSWKYLQFHRYQFFSQLIAERYLDFSPFYETLDLDLIKVAVKDHWSDSWLGNIVESELKKENPKIYRLLLCTKEVAPVWQRVIAEEFVENHDLERDIGDNLHKLGFEVACLYHCAVGTKPDSNFFNERTPDQIEHLKKWILSFKEKKEYHKYRFLLQFVFNLPFDEFKATALEFFSFFIKETRVNDTLGDRLGEIPMHWIKVLFFPELMGESYPGSKHLQISDFYKMVVKSRGTVDVIKTLSEFLHQHNRLDMLFYMLDFCFWPGIFNCVTTKLTELKFLSHKTYFEKVQLWIKRENKRSFNLSVYTSFLIPWIKENIESNLEVAHAIDLAHNILNSRDEFRKLNKSYSDEALMDAFNALADLTTS